jgi:hypothetical protein
MFWSTPWGLARMFPCILNHSTAATAAVDVDDEIASL